jgi:hypothetical protein
MPIKSSRVRRASCGAERSFPPLEEARAHRGLGECWERTFTATGNRQQATGNRQARAEARRHCREAQMLFRSIGFPPRADAMRDKLIVLRTDSLDRRRRTNARSPA